MKICILGAGVIGLTTAWELAAHGHEIAIVDRQGEPGAETSFANAGQLSFAYVVPLATPDILWRLPALILDREAPMRIRPTLDPAFLRWCGGFVAACTTPRLQATVAAQLALATLSRDVLDALERDQSLSFARRTAGKLVLYRKGASFEGARRHVRGGQQVLTPFECVSREPAACVTPSQIAGGIYTPDEQVGDCHLFCRELAARLRRRNEVAWHMSTTVRRPVVRQGALRAVETDQGVIEADCFVLALGPEAPHFARAAAVRLPIYPMKGYSITARTHPSAPRLAHSVTDYDRKMAFAPLEDHGPVVRITGGADLVGYDRSLDGKRIAALTRHAGEMLALASTDDLRPWAGLRPATPDGRPIIGWSPVRNLFLNVGHGALGWTLACGSARLAAELIEGAPPSVGPGLFALRRAA